MLPRLEAMIEPHFSNPTPTMRLACLAVLGLAAAPAAAADRLTVMVLYFDNQTNAREYDVLKKGLADMMITDLAQDERLAVVEREKLEAIIAELKLQRSRLFDPRTAQKLGKLAGAAYSLAGSIVGLSPKVVLDVRLVENATARVKLSARVDGSAEDLFGLQQELVRRFFGALELKVGALGLKSGRTDLTNLLRYSNGVDLADKGQLDEAKKTLSEVLAESPDFHLASATYGALVKRLYQARQKRAELLADDATMLAAKVDEETKGGLPDDDEAAERYLTYRSLRLQLLFKRMRELPVTGDAVAASARGQYVALVGALLDEVASVEAELERYCARLPPDRYCRADADLDEDDARRLEALGQGDDADVTGHGMLGLSAARFLATGQTFGDDWTWVRPPPVVLDEGLARRAEALTRGLEKRFYAEPEGAPGMPREMKARWAADARVAALLKLGRREEAVAVLQRYLDTFPRAADYKEVEAQVERALDVHPSHERARAAIEKCDNMAVNDVREYLEDLARYEPRTLDKVVEAIEARCAGTGADITQQSMRFSFYGMSLSLVAQSLTRDGDCQRVRSLRDRLRARGERLPPVLQPSVDTFAKVLVPDASPCAAP